MKKHLYAILAAAVLAGVQGCVQTDDITVESVTNDKVNLKGYKTYQFLDGSGVIEENKRGKVKEGDQKIAALIEDVINEQLDKAGKAPSADHPDFFVAYVGGTDPEAVTVKLDKKGKEVVQNRPEAALLILLVDADTGSILRLATAEGELKKLPEAQQRKRIEYAVKKMLKDI